MKKALSTFAQLALVMASFAQAQEVSTERDVNLVTNTPEERRAAIADACEENSKYLCIPIVIRDFNLWNANGFQAHPDFEAFANTQDPTEYKEHPDLPLIQYGNQGITTPYVNPTDHHKHPLGDNHGCGNKVLTQADYLLSLVTEKTVDGAGNLVPSARATLANNLLQNPAIANAPLMYGELRSEHNPAIIDRDPSYANRIGENGGVSAFTIELQMINENIVARKFDSSPAGHFMWINRVKTTEGMVYGELVPSATETELVATDDGQFVEQAKLKPAKVAEACDNSMFDQWFNNSEVSHNVNEQLILVRDDSRSTENSKTYVISSNAFFPLDLYHGSTEPGFVNFGKQAYTNTWCGYSEYNSAFKTTGAKCLAQEDGNNFNVSDVDARNYGYTIEGGVTFAYHGGEVFTFSGDDDMWIFIDGKLVADLGGVHLPAPKTISMDQLAAANGWQPKTQHRLHFFYADRQTTGSNLIITTTLNNLGPNWSLPPRIIKGRIESGVSNSFVIHVSQPLDDATINAINGGLLPDPIIVAKGGITGEQKTPAVASIEAVQDTSAGFGITAYKITLVGAGRPNSSDYISLNPEPAGVAAGTSPYIVGKASKGRVRDIRLKPVDFIISTAPAVDVIVETPQTLKTIPFNPDNSVVRNQTYAGTGSTDPAAGAPSEDVPVDLGAEMIITGYTNAPTDFAAWGRSTTFGEGVKKGTFGIIGGRNNPKGLDVHGAGNTVYANSNAVPDVGEGYPTTCQTKYLGVTPIPKCIPLSFEVSGPFRINVYIYDMAGQFIRQYSQEVTQDMANQIRWLQSGAGSDYYTSANPAEALPVFTSKTMRVDLGIFPISTSGRLLGNGAYIMNYDIVEYPQRYAEWEPTSFDELGGKRFDGALTLGNLDFTDGMAGGNRTIKSVVIGYRR